MIFSLNEQGDLEYDSENKTLSVVIPGDPIETDFKVSRTAIISHFILKGAFSSYFIKNKRNVYNNEYVENFLEEQLDLVFKTRKDIRKYIKYFFKLEGEVFTIMFYYKDNVSTRIIMKKEIIL